MIPESHPLQQLFVELVGRHYAEEIGIRDPQVVNYVAQLLAEFVDVEQLFKVRNVAGKPLSDVGEMLLESDPVYGPAPSFDRERHASLGMSRDGASRARILDRRHKQRGEIVTSEGDTGW